MTHNRHIQLALLFARFSIFLVLAVWTLDKFLNPGHAMKIFENFYFIPGIETMAIYSLAVLEVILLLFFISGTAKRYSYGIVVIIHGVSTFSAFKQYLAPYDGANLLFFAAWPMLAACVLLYVMRDEDRLLSWGK